MEDVGVWPQQEVVCVVGGAEDGKKEEARDGFAACKNSAVPCMLAAGVVCSGSFKLELWPIVSHNLSQASDRHMQCYHASNASPHALIAAACRVTRCA